MNIANSEMKLMEIIWETAPIKSGELVGLAYSRLGWKKSTVYTVIKKLQTKGTILSEDAVIRPLVSKGEVFEERSGEVLRSGYSGSLPMFLTAFLSKEKLSTAEAKELKELIDRYTEEEK